MKIVLYYKYQPSLVSRLISFITRSDITHASIINKGSNFDTDLMKDAFMEDSDLLYNEPDRKCIVYDLGDDVDCSEWINRVYHTPYDLIGYFLWIFGSNPKEMHCFDTIVEVLKFLKYPVPEDLEMRPTGTKLKTYLDTLGFKSETTTCKDVLKYVS